MSQFQISEWQMDKTGLSAAGGGMVVAKQDRAALAGAEMLKAGGNAIDAACAAAWVMAVMEPHLNTIGGAGYIVFRKADGEAHVIDYSNRAPAAATPEALASRTTAAFDGPLAAAVPATVSGLTVASERFGKMPLETVMAPAIDVAENGMELDWHFALHLMLNLNSLRAQPFSREVFLVKGDPGIAHGEHILRQADLASTLKLIANGGPEAFYTGPIAREIVEFVRNQGGIISEDDFANYSATVEKPLTGKFGNYSLLTMPMPSPGLMTLQGLRMLDLRDVKMLGHNSADALHIMAESYRMAFADRDAYFGDPDFVEVPVEQLLNDDYIAERASLIDLNEAMQTVAAGDAGVSRRAGSHEGGGTTHICAIDGDGNMVSQTQTLIGGLTGLGVAGNTGVVMNCALQWFNHEPDTANSVEPNKRPTSNMTPIIAEKDGRAVLAAGAPGSRRISNAVSQVVFNTLAHEMLPQAAISAPRIDVSLGHIVADDRIEAAVLDELRSRGHKVDSVYEFINSGGPANSYRGNFARPNAIFVDDAGTRHGGDYQFAQGAVVATD
ncbi:MAG: gamma-glutamyltransferase [Sphaerobacteraceae bacterium]|nr:MAG: gamma-glutamyltransferase [Sphaerobacteraceae bacterium]